MKLQSIGALAVGLAGAVLLLRSPSTDKPAEPEVALGLAAKDQVFEVKHPPHFHEVDGELKVRLKLRNDLDVGLKLAAKRSSCGCVAADPQELEIPAGTSAPSQLRFDVKRREGVQRFFAELGGSDGKTRRIETLVLICSAVRLISAKAEPVDASTARLVLALRLCSVEGEEGASGFGLADRDGNAFVMLTSKASEDGKSNGLRWSDARIAWAVQRSQLHTLGGGATLHYKFRNREHRLAIDSIGPLPASSSSRSEP